VLKNVLKYTDIFTISVDINNKTISLRSNLKNSELSKMLNIDHKLLNKINTQLLSAFIKNNSNFGDINTLLYSDGIIIKWDYNFNSIKDIGPLFEIAKNLDYKSLDGLCKTNKQLSSLCKDNNFWINLFNYKFREIPNYIPRNTNYKKLYMDIVQYLEIIIEYLENEIMINKFKYLEKDPFIKNPFSDTSDALRSKILDIINNMNQISIIYLIKSKLFNIDINLIPALRESKHGYNLNILTELLSNYKLYRTNLNNYVKDTLLHMVSISNKEFENGLNILELLINHVRENGTLIREKEFTDMLIKSLELIDKVYIPLNKKQLIEFDFVIMKRFPNIDLTEFI